MIKVVDGVTEYCSIRCAQPPIDLEELGVDCGYRSSLLAQELGISCRQLERDFKKSLGVTPKGWLREQRALRAVSLIDEGRTLVEVSQALGFKRYGHFSREILAFFGVRPGELVTDEDGMSPEFS